MTGKRQDPVYQAQAILSRRDHSVKEMHSKLRRQGFGEQEIAKTLAWLQEKRLLNDRRFAAAYADALVRSKPVGPRYLSAKLKQKGVADSLIREIIHNIFSDGRQQALIANAIARWKRLHPNHDRQRLYRFLVSRGFTADAISESVLPPGDG